MKVTSINRGVLGIVQFLHPGQEHMVTPNGWTPWNRGLHRRKYMCCEGASIDSHGEVQQGGIFFWGEWEGPSRLVYSWNDASKTLPTNLVVPVYPGRPQRIDGLQNTDPYVFGSAFKYTLCKQVKRNGQETLLTGLMPGSLILFGSNLEGSFVLDTVLVVGQHTTQHSALDWEEKFSSTSEKYRSMTLFPMYWDKNTRRSSVYTYYEGATLNAPFNGMYSFVPALRESAEPSRFRRPAVAYTPAISQSLKMNYKFTEASSTQIALVWESIRQQVLEQNLVLGLDLAEPRDEVVPDEVWPKFNQQ